MPKPALLIFVEYYLPGYKFGGPVQSVANLIALLKPHYTIYLVTRDRDFRETAPYPGIPADEWVAKDGYQIRYVSPARTSLRGVWSLLNERHYDYVYTNSFFAPFTRQLLLITAATGRKLIIAPRGELHPGALGLKSYKKYPFVWLTKHLFTNQLIWHATDQEELQAIRHHFARYKVQFAPVRYAPDTPKRLKKRGSYTKQPGTVRLVFISRLTQKKGILFLLQLLTRYSGGQVILDIYGPIVDEANWLKCEALLTQMSANCQVSYRGSIHHDLVNETLIGYDFFVLPTLGENFGHAIFEAMSAGVPVLISDQTPWRELAAQQAGWNVPLAEEAWIDALNEAIAMDNETYARWSAKAVDVTMAYIKDNKFEQNYLALFS